MNISREKKNNEAIRRLQQLVEQMGLNPKVVDYFQQGKIYYSYITGGVIGSIDTITYDPRYEKAVQDFESQYEGFVVYHAIETGDMLSLLYVSDIEEDWPAEVLCGDYITSYTINFEEGIEEFGDIFISGYMNSGALIRTDYLPEVTDIEIPEEEPTIKPQKKHMVDFINQKCRLKGKKIPKYALNRFDESKLMSLIESDAGLKAAFDDYMRFISRQEKNAAPKKATQSKKAIQPQNATDASAAAESFREAVKQLLADGTSMLAIMDFTRALDELPKGAISSDEMHEIIDKLTEAGNNAAAFKLLAYSIKNL